MKFLTYYFTSIFTAGVLMLGICNVNIANAAPVFFAGTGNYYDFIFGDLSANTFDWADAKADAESKTFFGVTGHLAVITSDAENSFVFPLSDDAGGWLGGFQPAGSPEPAGNWTWITGEAFIYDNWPSFEPNNSGPGGAEDGLLLQASGLWNDLNLDQFEHTATGPGIGYFIEYETAGAVPLPATVWLFGSGLLGLVGMARRKKA